MLQAGGPASVRSETVLEVGQRWHVNPATMLAPVLRHTYETMLEGTLPPGAEPLRCSHRPVLHGFS